MLTLFLLVVAYWPFLAVFWWNISQLVIVCCNQLSTMKNQRQEQLSCVLYKLIERKTHMRLKYCRYASIIPTCRGLLHIYSCIVSKYFIIRHYCSATKKVFLSSPTEETSFSCPISINRKKNDICISAMTNQWQEHLSCVLC